MIVVRPTDCQVSLYTCTDYQEDGGHQSYSKQREAKINILTRYAEIII